MGKRRAEPDYALVLGVLTQAERTMIAGWLEELGAPPGSWPTIPPLRQLVTMLAVLRLAAGMPMCRLAAFAEACSALGLEDDTDRATRPSDSYVRTLARWLEAADAGQNVRPSKAAAA